MQARTAIKSDSLQSLVQLGNARLAMLTAENDLRTANAALTRLVASPQPVTAIPDDVGADSIVAVDSAQIAALALGGPAVRQASANLTAAQKQRPAARGAWWPTLTASYGRNRVGADSVFTLSPDNYSYSGQIRFSLSYPIFDQWSRQQIDHLRRGRRVERRRLAARRPLRRPAEPRPVPRRAPHRGASRWPSSRCRSPPPRRRCACSSSATSSAPAPILDELTSQTTLNQARYLLIQARFNYRVAKAQLEALIGRQL